MHNNTSNNNKYKQSQSEVKGWVHKEESASENENIEITILRSIVSTSEEAILISGAKNGNLIFWNSKAETIFEQLQNQTEKETTLHDLVGKDVWSSLQKKILGQVEKNRAKSENNRYTFNLSHDSLAYVIKASLIEAKDSSYFLLRVHENSPVDISNSNETKVRQDTNRDPHQEKLIEMRTQDLQNINAKIQKKNTALNDINKKLSDEISMRINTEIALRESEIKFRSFIEQSQDAIALINSSGEIILWNDSSRKLYEVPRENALGEYIWEIDYQLEFRGCLPAQGENKDKKVEEFKTSFFDFIATANDRHTLNRECSYITEAGQKKVVEIVTFPILTEQDTYMGRLSRDVTEKKRAQEEILIYKNNLEQLVKERTEELEQEKINAEESDRLKTAFLANISHEIRTPMNGILGFTELLHQDDLETDDRSRYMKAIQDSTKQLLHVINDIIEASRIQSGQVSFRKSKGQLKKIFTQVFENHFYNQSLKKELEFSSYSENEEFLDQTLLTDFDILLQILNQLVNNAIKFTTKGEITIGVLTHEKSDLPSVYHTFFVKDTGIGISKEKQKVIFQKFRQLDDSSTRLYGGMGLGLTIFKELVEGVSDGEIWIESETNTGSTFYFTFPLDVPEKELKPHKEIELNKIDLSGKKILIVEDDNLNFIYLKEVLTPFNPTLTWVKNGEDAVDKIVNNSFDVVLMDIQLPKMSGYEATKNVREKNIIVPIIAQTANAMREDEEKSLAVGCNAYLAKPIQRESLIRTIYQQINK